jgi:hypothetical protein
MEPTGILLDAFGRVHDGLHQALDGLTEGELYREPHPPIGWLAWRINRVQDNNMSRLAGREQAWIADGWHARFGMEPNPRDFGPALTHTREQVGAFRASRMLLLEYHDAVYPRTQEYLAALRSEDLDRELDEPRYQPLPTLGVRLVSVMESNIQDIGRIVYLRSLHRVGGWFPREG